MPRKTTKKTTKTTTATTTKTAPVAVEEVKAEPVEEVKAEPVKTKRAPAKKKCVLHPEVYIQFAGQETLVKEVTQKAKDLFVSEGHKEEDIKSLKLYLKPEEGAAYYVINEENAGKVELF
jgi:hypothetical protein